METVENFYGVYLLCCENPRYKGRTYIGFTVDPNRRIKQHNKGKKAGGAWKTSQRGPWVMVLIVHGFPNDIAALRFEWAWQHPQSSRRLKHLQAKKTREKVFDYQLRILVEMLRTGPWNRLPLTLRWLAEGYSRDIFVETIPGAHISISYGAVIRKKVQEKAEGSFTANNCCDLCQNVIETRTMRCLSPVCTLTAHVICLARHFLGPENGIEYVPIEGRCPKCELVVLWGDLVRKMKGCYKELAFDLNAEMGDEFCGSDSN